MTLGPPRPVHTITCCMPGTLSFLDPTSQQLITQPSLGQCLLRRRRVAISLQVCQGLALPGGQTRRPPSRYHVLQS